MPISIKDDNIVKGIPNYILITSLLVPILLFSGALGTSDFGAVTGSDGGGMYEFLKTDWKTWSEDEWDTFLDIILILNDVDDESKIPKEILDFISDLEKNESDYIYFMIELQEMLNNRHRYL